MFFITVRILLWIVTIIGVAIGSMEFIDGLIAATTAPQQAAQSAMALCWAVLPYIIARAFDQIDAARQDARKLPPSPAVESAPGSRGPI